MNQAKLPGALMRHEIDEQPRVLQHLLQSAPSVLERVLNEARNRDCSLVMLAARGSSDNASTYGKYLIESRLGWPVALAAPSLFTLYRQPPKLARALVVGVSQSGGSVDVVEVISQARAQGALTLALTNVAQSPLHRAAEYTVLLGAGEEKALAATKTVTAQCLAYALLALGTREAGRVPDEIAATLARNRSWQEWLPGWLGVQRCAVIGRGYTYGAAQEIALKLKETCFFSAEAYSGADFMHGPLALAEPGYPMLVLANHDETLDGTIALVKTALSRGAQVNVLGTDDAIQQMDDVLGASASASLRYAAVTAHAITAPLSMIAAGQCFTLELALERDHDPDLSRGVSKVTITR